MTDKAPCEFPGVNWFDQQEKDAVMDVIDNGAVFRYYGPNEPKHAAALEAQAKEKLGSKCALAVSGGTGGLITSMLALGVGPGDEVIVPAYFWVATVGAVVQCNAIPVICEVNESFNMDPDDLARKINDKTKLIVVVHMAGAPADMDRIMAIANERGIDVMEDCAQCNGGSFKGKRVGTFGKVGMFSFQINKNATSGEGGLLVTDDEELLMKLNAVHDVGVPWLNGAPDDSHPVHLWGQGRRMSELCAAVANVQFSKVEQIAAHMRASNHRIQEMLADVPGVTFRKLNDPEGDTGPFLVIVLEDEAKALAAAKVLNDGGMKTAWRTADYGMHVYYNIPQLVAKTPLSPAGNPWSLPQNADSVYDYGKGACPISDDLFARSLTITIPSRLSPEQEVDLANTIREAIS
jgi:dTDP-4-amino-4,6-dideoxygalactose transaminase